MTRSATRCVFLFVTLSLGIDVPAAAQPRPDDNLLVNGSFEQTPGSPHGIRELPGWRVTRGDVDILTVPYWQPAPDSGTQSLDLAGFSPGTIEQSFPAVPGQEYLFSGWIAHNADNSAVPEGRADVFISGQFLVQLFHRDPQATRADMRWVRFEHRFRATSASTTLTLVDVTNTWHAGGIFLDGLSVTPVSGLPPGPPRLGILPNPVTGGRSTVGLVALDRPAPEGDLVVSLASSDPAVVAVPAVVIVPAGASSVLFSVVTFPVSAPMAVTLSAAGPAGTRTGRVHVLPEGALPPAGNLLANGSFEEPRGRPGAGLGELPGWRITRGRVDLVTGWQQAPGEGAQSLDLVGDASNGFSSSAATIEQSIPTVTGREYLFSGWIAHHPGNPVAPEGRANVSLNGQLIVQLFHRDTRATESAMGWERFVYRFRAAAAATTLAITDVTGTWSRGGLVLDGLAVTLVQPNLLVNGSFEEPDLSATDRDFLAVPPGALPGWRSAGGPLHVVHQRSWLPAPSQGRQSLHLLGQPGAAGRIEQGIPTEPGRAYTLSGWVAHHPAIREGRALLILNGELQTQLFHSNALYGAPTPVGRAWDLQWQPFLVTFRAITSVTTLQIVDVTGLSATEGVALDGLTVTLAEEPVPGLLPAAPSALTVRLISPTQVDLAWRDNRAGESAFEIERHTGTGAWTRIALIAADTTRFSDFGVSPNTTYTYRVRAVNDTGSSAPSNEASVTTLPSP